MQLMTVTKYREKYYEPSSRPSRGRVIRMIQDGVLPGQLLGKRWYVDNERLEEDDPDKLLKRILSA